MCNTFYICTLHGFGCRVTDKVWKSFFWEQIFSIFGNYILLDPDKINSYRTGRYFFLIARNYFIKNDRNLNIKRWWVIDGATLLVVRYRIFAATYQPILLLTTSCAQINKNHYRLLQYIHFEIPQTIFNADNCINIIFFFKIFFGYL